MGGGGGREHLARPRCGENKDGVGGRLMLSSLAWHWLEGAWASYRASITLQFGVGTWR